MRRILLALALTALVAAGCAGDDDSSSSSGGGAYGGGGAGAPASAGGRAAAGAVSMVGTSFEPAELTAKVGEQVTWTNTSDLTHNVVADAGATFESDTFGRGGTFSFTPTKAGTITYECTLHPGMVGTVDVTE